MRIMATTMSNSISEKPRAARRLKEGLKFTS